MFLTKVVSQYGSIAYCKQQQKTSIKQAVQDAFYFGEVFSNYGEMFKIETFAKNDEVWLQLNLRNKVSVRLT